MVIFSQILSDPEHARILKEAQRYAMGLHMSSDKHPVGETAVPSLDPNWNYNDPEHIWEREHFLICVKAGLKGAQQKVISYAWVSAITQEPSENPIAFLERLKEALQVLLERSCRGAGLQTTIRQVVSSCPTCQLNNPQGAQKPQLAQPIQQCGAYPGEDWQMDFTQMPVSQGYKYLLVMIDTFTGWIEGFPTQTEKLRRW